MLDTDLTHILNQNIINLVHHTENRMKKSFVVAELSNFKFSEMAMRKRYTNINEMIDIIMDDDSNDEYDLGDDFSSTDESDLEYVEENLTNEASTEPESV